MEDLLYKSQIVESELILMRDKNSFKYTFFKLLIFGEFYHLYLNLILTDTDASESILISFWCYNELSQPNRLKYYKFILSQFWWSGVHTESY